MTAMPGMNRLEDWARLVGRVLFGGFYCRVKISGDTLSLLRHVYFYWWLFALFWCTFSLTCGARPPIVQDNEDMTAMYSEYTDVKI
jgi:hypothetical protein